MRRDACASRRFSSTEHAAPPGRIGPAAEYLGLTRKQLLAQLRTGRTLSQIAHAQEQQFLAKLPGRLDKLVQRN